MYSYERNKLHYQVMAAKLEKAAKLARELANFETYSYYPVERAKLTKLRLEKIIKEIKL